jgi:hypothetical protein
MEIPRHWRLKSERLRLATEVVSETNGSKLVRGFGNSFWEISNNGKGNSVDFTDKSESSNGNNGHDKENDPFGSRIIYQAPTKAGV